MFKRNFKLILVLLVVAMFGASIMAEAAAPKYVFYFIGDGLGASQRQVGEYYLQMQTGNPNAKLLMNQFPVAGINTTHALDTLVTDSAAAGTALACGVKTNNNIISKLPDGTDLKTLVEALEEKGVATGLVSTTRLTHATPAVFASHNIFRDNENEIAADMIASGVDYMAAGGYRNFTKKGGSLSSKRTDDRDLIVESQKLGFHTFISESETAKFRAFKPAGQTKVLALLTSSHMPYELDRDNNKVPSLAELTEKGIEILSQYNKGFFMMVEGGRIDHAAHANDAPGVIHDVIAFDDAIAKAYEFYKKHPKETLIVVVGDHETGGMGLGFGSNYFLKLDELVNVKVSVEDILQNVYNGDRAAFYQYIAANCGLKTLTEKEKTEIEAAMNTVDSKEKFDNYGGYNPVAIAVTHILSEHANLYWTTYAHSGTAIPMSAVGVGAEQFGGYKDNTEICRTMASLLGLKLSY